MFIPVMPKKLAKTPAKSLTYTPRTPATSAARSGASTAGASVRPQDALAPHRQKPQIIRHHSYAISKVNSYAGLHIIKTAIVLASMVFIPVMPKKLAKTPAKSLTYTPRTPATSAARSGASTAGASVRPQDALAPHRQKPQIIRHHSYAISKVNSYAGLHIIKTAIVLASMAPWCVMNYLFY